MPSISVKIVRQMAKPTENESQIINNSIQA